MKLSVWKASSLFGVRKIIMELPGLLALFTSGAIKLECLALKVKNAEGRLREDEMEGKPARG